MSDFLAFFDALQVFLPPLSAPILNAEARGTALQFMSNSMDVTITRESLKELYKQFTGKNLVQEHKDANDRSARTSPLKDVGTIRAKATTEDVRDVKPYANLEQLASDSPVATPKQTRKKPIGDYFKRPMSVRRQASAVTSGSELSDNEIPVGRSLDHVLNEYDSSMFVPLASSTPNQYRQTRDGAFSSPLLSPQGGSNFSLGSPRSRHGSSVGDSLFSHSSQPLSPNFDILNRTEQRLAQAYKELREESRAKLNLSAELAELRRVAEKARKDHEKELLDTEKEIDRLNEEIDTKRKEIDRVKGSKSQMDEEIAAYELALDETKKQLQKFEDLHHEDRDKIQEMTAHTNKLLQQIADSKHDILTMTNDLKRIMADKNAAVAEKEALQKKANFVGDMGRQIKQYKEDMKDRDVEIERLKAECDRRQQEIETLEHSMLTGGGGKGSSISNLSGDIEDNHGYDEAESDENSDDGEEEEQTITTTKTTKRKLKRNAGKGSVNPIAAAVMSSGNDSIVVEKVTSDRGIQTMPEPEKVTVQQMERPEMHDTCVQTNVSVGAITSLEDHFLALQTRDTAEFDPLALDKINAAEAMARDKALTVQQIEELSKAIGAQDEVIKKLINLGGTNVRTLFSRKAAKIDEGETFGYACTWVWKWIRLQSGFAKRNPLFWLYNIENEDSKYFQDCTTKFYLNNPTPSSSYIATYVLLWMLFLVTTLVTSRYIMAVNHHETMWRQANKFHGSSTDKLSVNPFGGRTLMSIKYEIEKRYGGKRKLPI